MNTVASLTKWIEDQFPVGPTTNGMLSVTGDPYVEIGMPVNGVPGVIEEGHERELAFDEETACLAAATCFREYAAGKSGTLYWRVKPQLEWNDDRTRAIVYMRCLVK